MLQGKISRLDVAGRTAVIVTGDRRELMVRFPEDAVFEVSEPETMGTMGGELSDLQPGYFVQIDIRDHNDDGSCNCSTLLSLS